MLKKIREIRLSSHLKLFLLFVASLMIPIVIASIMVSSFIRNQINQYYETMFTKEVSALSTKLDTDLATINSLCRLINTDNRIKSSIIGYRSAHLDYDTANSDISDTLKYYENTFSPPKSMLPSITIVTFQGDIFGSNKNKNIISSDKFMRFIKEFRSTYNKNKMWVSDIELSINSQIKHLNGIYCVQLLSDPDTYEPIAALVLQFRTSSLLKQIMGFTSMTQSTFIVSSNKIIASENNLKIAEENINDFDFQIIGNKNFLIGDKEYLYISYQLPSTKWTIASITEYNYNYKEITETYKKYYIVLFLIVSFSLGVSYIASRLFIKPIQRLIYQMKQVIAGDYSGRITKIYNDEIGDLSDSFNKMIDNTQKLMNKILEEQEAKRKVDIQFLQAQISPHFLYNTLASIRSVISTGNKEAADLMILSLSKIFRYSISDAQTFISINMEIEWIKNYLFITRYSFPVKLDIQYDIEQQIGDYKIMKMLLQPIVENAIYHGLKNNITNPMLVIAAKKEGNQIKFVVKDNGVGFNISEIEEKNQTRSFNNIGLHNVNKRLKLHFGNKYGLTIKSKEGVGTTVIICVPLIKEKEEPVLYEHTFGR